MADPVQPEEQPITQDQATAMVGKHLLAKLEDVIFAHKAVIGDETQSETAKANARLVVAAAQALGGPLFFVVKNVEKPRILRPERAIRIVR